jgi:hypothetical protein
MRVFASCLAVTLCVGCGPVTVPKASSPDPPSVPMTSVAATTVIPSNVMRARTRLPAGYELSALPADPTPAALWGMGRAPISDPQECAGLLAPIAADTPVDGWSASGAGGIVYVVVAQTNAEPAPAADCVPWTMSTDHTAAVISFTDVPVIAQTASALGLTADMTTRVEGGTETHSWAQTLVTYLDGDVGPGVGYVTYVVVVTDPGASGPPLEPGFASSLLVDAVAAIRS